MRKFFYLIKREINFLFYTKKSRLFFALIYPLIMFFILLAVFSQKAILKVPVAVIDNSRGVYAREFVRAVKASPYLDLKYTPQNMQEAKKLFLATKVYALLEIDKDYDKNLNKSYGANILALVNNQYLLMGGNVGKALTQISAELSNRHKIKFLSKQGISSSYSDLFTSPIKVSENILYNPQMNYVYFLVLGLVPALLQIFICLSITYSLLYELKTRRAKKIKPYILEHPYQAVFAKSIVYLAIYLLVFMVMLFTLIIFFDLPLRGNLLLVLLGAVVFCLCSAGAGVFISGATNNLRIAMSACAVYGAPAFAYYGVSFPIESMPLLAQLWAYFLPGTYLNRIMVNEIIRSGATAVSLHEILIMLIFALIFFFSGAKLYARWFKDEKYMGAKL